MASILDAICSTCCSAGLQPASIICCKVRPCTSSCVYWSQSVTDMYIYLDYNAQTRVQTAIFNEDLAKKHFISKAR